LSPDNARKAKQREDAAKKGKKNHDKSLMRPRGSIPCSNPPTPPPPLLCGPAMLVCGGGREGRERERYERKVHS